MAPDSASPCTTATWGSRTPGTRTASTTSASGSGTSDVTASRIASRLARRMSLASIVFASTTPIANGDRVRPDFPIEVLAGRGVEFLGVVQAGQDATGRQG